jgi:DNA-binding MarR family transcriptional regulator
MDWKKYAWLKRGKSRQATAEVIRKSPVPLSINDIHQRAKIALSQASTTISDLEKKGLIECLNPEDKIGKLYRITPEGKELLQKLEEK